MRSCKSLQTTTWKYQETPTRNKPEVHAYKSFTEVVFKAAIKQQKNIVPREDTIHPQIIKILPP